MIEILISFGIVCAVMIVIITFFIFTCWMLDNYPDFMTIIGLVAAVILVTAFVHSCRMEHMNAPRNAQNAPQSTQQK